jgi:hypothetical protein
MSTKSSRINYANLGHKVTTTIINYGQMVREAEGSRWNLPIGIWSQYPDSNISTYVSYNQAVTGPEENL